MIMKTDQIQFLDLFFKVFGPDTGDLNQVIEHSASKFLYARTISIIFMGIAYPLVRSSGTEVTSS